MSCDQGLELLGRSDTTRPGMEFESGMRKDFALDFHVGPRMVSKHDARWS